MTASSARNEPINVVTRDDLHDGWLRGFERRQVTTRVLRAHAGRTHEAEDHFIDDWDGDALRGVVRGLFERVRAAALGLGATRLHIGAHPSVETQAFYRGLGCRLARYVHAPMLEREPLDLQLELGLREPALGTPVP